MKLSKTIWIILSFSSLSILFFGFNYCTTVCQFIDGLRNEQVIRNLFIIFLLHMITRMILIKTISYKNFQDKLSPFRFLYYISIISWILAGIYAAALHHILYPNFPFGSHFKLLSGYWLIGAGVLSQMEYVIFEYYLKKQSYFKNLLIYPKETLSKRILEGFIIFTLLPVTTLVLLVYRYYLEGKIDGHLIGETLYIGIFSIAVAIFVALFIGHLLKRDTKIITQKLKHIEDGYLDGNIELKRVDELASIANGINYMNEGLILRGKIQEGFGKFVDPFISKKYIEDVVNNQSQSINFTGETNDVAILMCDIRNFTQISESLNPKQTVELLNIFFNESVSIFKAHQGIINKFIGDAIMVVYGLEDDQYKNKNALSSAIQLQNYMTKINQQLSLNNLPSINIGIGLHSGIVSSGYVGNSDRLEFTVIGSTVNIAARIESQTKILKEKILFSEDFNEHIKKDFSTHFVDKVQLKGVSKPINLFTTHSQYTQS